MYVMVTLVWMRVDGNNQNFDYFLIKFNDFDQINIGGVTLTYFIEFSIKSISQ